MNKKQKSLTNKGFSLVELIIVIAIMAVLIGVLAPQYLKYVERSRESSDLTNYQEIMSALQVYASDTTASPALGTGTVVCEKGSATTTTGDGVAAALKAASITPANLSMKSTKYGTATITVGVDTNGVPTFSTNNSDLATEIGISVTP